MTISAIFAEMCNAAVSLPDILELSDLENVEVELVRSRLSGAALEQACRLTARPLKVSASTLLEEIQDERRKLAARIPEPIPGITPRPLFKILEAIIEVLTRYVLFLLPEQPLILALWVIHTWLFAAFDYSPIVVVYAPAIRSGKSRLLEVLELVCRNAELTEGASAAALIRIIRDGYVPTFLLDELDTIYGRKGSTPEGENLRRFLNAGFHRGATFLRCGWKEKEVIVERFACFCPKAGAAVNQCLPSSVADRSIPIELKRQSKEKKAQKMRNREAVVSVVSLRDELAVLAADEELIQTLNKARPAIPDELHDRQQDITEPLLAIAEHIGGEWPEKTRKALIKLCTGETAEEDIRIRLLADIKQVFDETGAKTLFTQTLLEKLVAIGDDAPWPEWFEALLKAERVQSAASKLARQLRRYKVKPVTVWQKDEYGDDVFAKGYQREHFEDVWKRYLPENPPTNSDSSRQAVRNSDNSLTTNEKQSETQPLGNPLLTTESLGRKSLKEKGITQKPDGLTAKMHENGEEIISSPKSTQSDQSGQPEQRLGHMPLDQMMDEIRQHFPNAKTLPSDNPEPDDPPPDSSPEFPF
jgi:hypothetical protein